MNQTVYKDLENRVTTKSAEEKWSSVKPKTLLKRRKEGDREGVGWVESEDKREEDGKENRVGKKM